MLGHPHKNWRCHRSDDVTIISILVGRWKIFTNMKTRVKFETSIFIAQSSIRRPSSVAALIWNSILLWAHQQQYHYHRCIINVIITSTIDIHLCANSSSERVSSHPVASRPDQALKILKMVKITMMVMVMTKYCPNVADTVMILLWGW